MSKGEHWIPAVCVRAGDQIIHAGLASTVTQVARLNIGPKYLISTERGDFTAGASLPIALLQAGESHDNRDDHDDGPNGNPQQRRRRRAV